MITKLNNFDCSNRSSDLNYPSFVAFYCDNTTTLKEKRFQRTITNVEGASTYKAKVTAPLGSEIKVMPQILEKEANNKINSYFKIQRKPRT